MSPRKGLKVVADPISGIIDIGPVLPIVETRAFQALEDKRQLGMTYLVFRAAQHTRFMHSLGSYWATRELANRWILQRSITAEEGDALSVFALLHDVGHSAFSHVTEDFCKQDHKETTLELIRGELKEAIKSCGVDTHMVEALAEHVHPLYKAVCDKNIGMEKLDYLERDGLSTILSRPVGIEYLRQYVYHVDDQVVIDEKVVEHALDTLTFYMKMYKEVYLRKSLVIAQRMFHKAVYHLLQAGELSAEELPQLTDSELLGRMSQSKDAVVRDMYTRIRERRLFREALVIRPNEFTRETRRAGKSILVVGVEQEEMRKLSSSSVLQKNNHESMENLEAKIARIAGIPENSVLLVPVFYPERFKTEDVLILGSDGQIQSLKERRPRHFAGMEETAQSYTALRICTDEKYRTTLSSSNTASKIAELVSKAE